jgi:hypothetical protein
MPYDYGMLAEHLTPATETEEKCSVKSARHKQNYPKRGGLTWRYGMQNEMRCSILLSYSPC